jgi:hypothetical protein
LGSPVTLSATGVATMSINTLSVGQHVITATYNPSSNPSPNFMSSVSASNTAPNATITGPPTGSVNPIGSTFTFTANFSDTAGTTATSAWSFDALVSAAGTVDNTLGTISLSKSFATAGVYSTVLTVNDSVGGITIVDSLGGLSEMAVVYDPSGGFVTGGGWIISPVFPALPYMTVSGKANFGFVSKYQKGANIPTGDTEFQFKEGNMNFKSTSYEWLVVAGARAQYKGVGKINGGSSDFGFMLTAIDSSVNGGGNADTFRIKIWDKLSGLVVYDNQNGQSDDSDAGTALGGGSIVIHK